MKTVSAGLAAHLALPMTTLATCLALTRTDGVVIRATSHDQNLTIDGQVYYATSGGTVTDVQTSAALNVDNSEVTALLTLDAITEADLKAGIYDNATYTRFLVNYADLTQGRLTQQTGTTGQVTVDRLTFTAELRGLMQSLQQTFGRTCTPGCAYILGDDDCTKSLTSFTVTGTLDSASADGMTLIDAARTEAGPGGGISITAITNANPCVITTATAISSLNGEAVTLSGITGPAALNGTVTIRNKSGSTFQIGIDTSDTAAYPSYTGGGVCTPLGATSGYFDYGLLTITSGTNNGISREVKSYVPGQLTLQEPFPYALAGTETYSLVAGCDKTAQTCRVKFSNILNFGGFPEVPGQDSIVQVGRR